MTNKLTIALLAVLPLHPLTLPTPVPASPPAQAADQTDSNGWYQYNFGESDCSPLPMGLPVISYINLLRMVNRETPKIKPIPPTGPYQIVQILFPKADTWYMLFRKEALCEAWGKKFFAMYPDPFK